MRFGDYQLKLSGLALPKTEQKEQQDKYNEPIIKIEGKKENLDKLPQGYAIEKQSDDDTDLDNNQSNANPVVNNNDTDDDTDVDSTNENTQDNDTTAEEPADNDEENPEGKIDRKIDTSARIHAPKSIAEHKPDSKATEIGMAVESAIFYTQNNDDKDADYYINAFNSLQNGGTEFIDEVPEKTHIYGNVTYEFAKYQTKNADGSEYKVNTKVYQGIFGGTYGKKYDNGSSFKMVGYAFTNKTDDKYINVASAKQPETQETDLSQEVQEQQIDTQEQPTDEQNQQTDIQEEILEDYVEKEYNEKSADYKAFLAAQYKFSNNDKITASASYFFDGSKDSRYDGMLKWESYKHRMFAQGNITGYYNRPHEEFDIYGDDGKKGTRRSVITNFKFGFNHEMDADNAEEPQLQNSAEAEENQNAATPTDKSENTKGWSRLTKPYIISDIIGESYENGVGTEQYFRKKSEDSNLEINSFAQYSIKIVPGEEKDTLDYVHNFLVGADVNYTSKLNSNSSIDASLKVRDKYAFGEGNIFAAAADVSYTAKKFLFNAEAKYISVPGVSRYFGAGCDVSYSPKDWLTVYGSANYVDLKQTDSSLKGSSVQAGVRLTF